MTRMPRPWASRLSGNILIAGWSGDPSESDTEPDSLQAKVWTPAPDSSNSAAVYYGKKANKHLSFAASPPSCLGMTEDFDGFCTDQ